MPDRDPAPVACSFTADYKHYSDPSVPCEFEVTTDRSGYPCCGYHYVSGGRLHETAVVDFQVFTEPYDLARDRAEQGEKH